MLVCSYARYLSSSLCFSFALCLFGSLSSLSLLSYHPSSSNVSMSFLHSPLLLSSPLHSLCRAPSRGLLKSNREVSAPPAHYRMAVKDGGGEGEMDLPSLPVCCSVQAVLETILSPHPSLLAGQHSGLQAPTSLPVSGFTAFCFSRWERKSGEKDVQDGGKSRG